MKSRVPAAALAFSWLIFSGCVAHHSVKGYQPVGPSSDTGSRISIHIDSHSYKQGGLFVDDRAPFTARVSTHDSGIKSLRIDEFEVTLGHQRHSLLAQKPVMVRRLPETAGTLSLESPRTFSFTPAKAGEQLEVKVMGVINPSSTARPFYIRKNFHYQERNKIWMLTFEDILSV